MTFSDFYQAIYDRSPFPWQVCLADRVIDANSGWPEVLDLPTAAGKTTVLDIAVFHLVHQLRTGVPRTAPLRIFSIVDRRIVVDGTFRHARRIADKLADAQDGPLRAAKDLIKSHFDVDRPLHVSMMRGGMYRDIGWISSPVQPTICVSTVDQVGSRLLFRGYGVTPSMRPVHAGLVANDSLLFIDEAHLSEPFLQTLAAVRSLTRVSAADEAIGRPLRFVRMSATSGDTEVKPFGLDENPHDLDTEHPVLKQRLAASKIATFKKVTVEKNDRDLADKHFARVASEQALSLAGFGPSSKTPRHKDSDDAEEPIPNPVRVVGIVVNRVRAARLIREELLQVVGRPDDDARKADVLLLTGRIRPFDRDELLFRCDANGRRGWLSWIAADRKEQPHRPLFVVATQTIEVGADISFDALVTEAAPLDCLRQRFGRLDRLGTRGRSSAVIVGRNTAVATNAVDPIYGTAIGETWTWLNRSDVARGSGATKSVDFGLAAIGKKLGNLSAADVSRMCAPRKNSPFLQTPYVELWSQTNPAPGADPDIARFLHGVETRPPDVQVIWRADLLNQGEAELLNEHEADYINATALVPPTQMECAPPVRDVRMACRPSR